MLGDGIVDFENWPKRGFQALVVRLAKALGDDKPVTCA